MARGLKANPHTKGRFQQTLKAKVAREIAKIPRTRSASGHDWLIRHMERQNNCCAYCGIPISLKPHRGKADRHATLDHVVPLALNGADSEENTVAACEACNNAKGHMNLQSFRATPFFQARKAYAATVPVRQTLTIIVKPRKHPPA